MTSNDFKIGDFVETTDTQYGLISVFQKGIAGEVKEVLCRGQLYNVDFGDNLILSVIKDELKGLE